MNPSDIFDFSVADPNDTSFSLSKPSAGNTLEGEFDFSVAEQVPPVARVLQEVSGRNPDVVADSRRLAKQQGLSPELVEEFHAEVSGKAEAERLQRHLSWVGGAGTMRFIADPENAALAHDDVETLAKIEQDCAAWREMKRFPFAVAKGATELGVFLADSLDYAETKKLELFGVDKMHKKLFGQTVFGEIRDMGRGLIQANEQTLSSKALEIPEEYRKRLLDNLGLVTDMGYLVTQVGEMAPSMALSIGSALLTGGGSVVAGLTGGGLEGASLSEELQQDGISQDKALAAGIAMGCVASVLNAIGFDKLLKKMPKETVAHNFARRLAGGATEGFTEYLEEPAQAVITGITKGESTPQIIDRVVDSLKNVEVMLGAGMVGVATTGGIPKTIKRVEGKLQLINEAGENAARLAALSETVSESKLAERSPEAFGGFVNSVFTAVEDETGENFGEQFIDAGQFAMLFQEGIEEGQDIGTVEDVLSRLEVSPEDFGKALQQGSVMSLSIPTLMQNCTKQERDMLIPHMKANPLAMSEAESLQLDINEEARRTIAQYEPDMELESALDAERSRIVEGLVGQGVHEDNAKVMAAIPHAFAKSYSTYGLDGVDFLRRMHVGEVGAELGVSQTASLEGNIESTSPLQFDYENSVPNAQSEVKTKLKQGQRGSLSFLPDNNYLIKLGSSADSSTFVHECAHVFLAELSRMTGQKQVFDQNLSSPKLADIAAEQEMLGEALNAGLENSVAAINPQGVPYKKIIPDWENKEEAFRTGTIDRDFDEALYQNDVKYDEEKATLVQVVEAETPADVPAQLQKDMETLRKWMKLNDGDAIATEHHEKFARGFEAYLREGKAPSLELAQVFKRFRDWLLSIYKNVKLLHVDLNNDVRDVFDRMLATSEQVREALYINEMVKKERVRLNELTEANDVDRAFLGRELSETERLAIAAVDRVTLRDRKKRKNAAKKEARAIVDNEPVYHQIMSITKGSGLDEAYMLEYYGKDTVADIHKKHRGLIKKNGQMADDIASELGYDEAGHMVDAFVDAPRRTERIQQLADELFAAEEAQVNPEELVLASEAFGRYLEKRNAELSKRTRSRTYSTREYIRRYVKEQIGATVIRKATRYDIHQHTMRKHSKLREEAARKKNDNAEAFHLEKLRDAFEMIGEAIRVREETKKIVNRAKKFAKNKSGLDFHYRDHIRALVQRFGMGGKSLEPQNPADMSSLRTLLESEKDINDMPPSFPEWLVDGTEQVNWKDLTVDQLRAVNDLIQFLNHRGRESRKESKAVSKERIDNAAEACTEGAQKNARKLHQKGTFKRKFMDMKDSIFASLDTLQYLLATFDAVTDTGKNGERGANVRLIFDLLVAAQNEKSRKWAEMERRVGPALVHLRKTVSRLEKQHGKSFSRIRLTDELRKQIGEGANATLEGQEYLELVVPEIMQQDGRKWTGDAILGLMLHTGTKSNMERVFAGYPELKEGQTLAYLKSMFNHKDWDAIQEIWDAIDSLYPELDAVHKTMNGFHMTKIEAQPFGIERGGVVKKYAGGYFPAIYDNTLPQTHFVKQYTELDELMSRSEAINQTPAARSGFTQGRKNKAPGFPLKLSVNVAVEHMYETIHYMTHAEALRFADRVTKHQKWEKAFKEVMGEAAYNAVRGHLKAIARPEQPVRDVWQRVGENLRTAATPFILGWNLGVAAKQIFSLPGGVHDIGMKEFCKGLKTVMSHSPRKQMQWIHEVSPYMRDRSTSMDRELSDMANKFRMDVRTIEVFGKELSHQDAVDLGFWPIRMADMATTYVLWVSAYEKAMRRGKSPEEAVLFADDIIRKSQPSSQAIDQTMWQRHKGAMRMLSMFQTFTVRTFGARQRHHYRAMRDGKMSKVEYAKYVLYDQIFPPIAMQLAFALLWGDAPDLDDDEQVVEFMLDMGAGVAMYQFAGIPLVSSVFSAFDADRMPAGTGLVLAQRALRTGWDFFENPDEKQTERMLWSLFHLGSYATKIPVSQVARRFKKGMEQREEGEGTIFNYAIPQHQ
ncbi:hypothetical protein [Halodesulfovibrio sp.]|jgi:hypothetical protein|uniref:hypothetical protein n=1 Tax=Halodesulfovibrio sp. TaxID=1912772 RepID=UPI0025D662BE|nr:hypothetical protein [Halodesulfovibrio sp.]MCT4626968.1 hypothetical protein [Halodesulfovibrio sp.]